MSMYSCRSFLKAIWGRSALTEISRGSISGLSCSTIALSSVNILQAAELGETKCHSCWAKASKRRSTPVKAHDSRHCSDRCVQQVVVLQHDKTTKENSCCTLMTRQAIALCRAGAFARVIKAHVKDSTRLRNCKRCHTYNNFVLL